MVYDNRSASVKISKEFLWLLLSDTNIKEALKTTNAVKDASMAMPRKLPKFSQQVIESDFQ